MTDKEKTDFGITLKQIVGMFDTMFDKEFPYMMCMHNAPVTPVMLRKIPLPC